MPKTSSTSVPTAVTSDGSCVRDPAWSIAAVREVDEPTANPPLAPAARLPRPKAKRSRLGLVAVVALLAVRARDEQALGGRHQRERDRRRDRARATSSSRSPARSGSGGPASTAPSTATPASSRSAITTTTVATTSTTSAHGTAAREAPAEQQHREGHGRDQHRPHVDRRRGRATSPPTLSTNSPPESILTPSIFATWLTRMSSARPPTNRPGSASRGSSRGTRA